VLPRKVVGRLLPLNNICESAKKLEPVRVIVWELPADTLVGEMLRKIGIFEELCSRGLRIASS